MNIYSAIVSSNVKFVKPIVFSFSFFFNFGKSTLFLLVHC